jgi:hypothetical protein
MNYMNILIAIFLIILIFLVLKSLCSKENFFFQDNLTTNDYTIKDLYRCNKDNYINDISINDEYEKECNSGNDVLEKNKNCLNKAYEKCNNDATCLGIEEFIDKVNGIDQAQYRLCKNYGEENPKNLLTNNTYKFHTKNITKPNTNDDIDTPSTPQNNNTYYNTNDYIDTPSTTINTTDISPSTPQNNNTNYNSNDYIDTPSTTINTSDTTPSTPQNNNTYYNSNDNGDTPSTTINTADISADTTDIYDTTITPEPSIYETLKQLIKDDPKYNSIEDEIIETNIINTLKSFNNRNIKYSNKEIVKQIKMVLDQHQDVLSHELATNDNIHSDVEKFLDLIQSAHFQTHSIDQIKDLFLNTHPNDMKDKLTKEELTHYKIIHSHLKLENVKNKNFKDWKNFNKTHPKYDLDEIYTDTFRDHKNDDESQYKGLDSPFINKEHNLGVYSYDEMSDDECPKGQKCWTGISKESLQFRKFLKNIEDKLQKNDNMPDKLSEALLKPQTSNKPVSNKSLLQELLKSQTQLLNVLKDQNKHTSNDNTINTTASIYLNNNGMDIEEEKETTPSTFLNNYNEDEKEVENKTTPSAYSNNYNETTPSAYLNNYNEDENKTTPSAYSNNNVDENEVENENETNVPSYSNNYNETTPSAYLNNYNEA